MVQCKTTVVIIRRNNKLRFSFRVRFRVYKIGPAVYGAGVGGSNTGILGSNPSKDMHVYRLFLCHDVLCM